MKGKTKKQTSNEKVLLGLMSSVTLAIAVMLTMMFFSTSLQAGAHSFTKVELEQLQIKEEQVEFVALETFDGKKITIGELKNALINSEQLKETQFIETTKGEIFYPEEIEYVFVEQGHTLGGQRYKRFPFDNGGL